MQFRPKAIRLDKTRRVLEIPWDDGMSSEYGWDGLRAACPCASCRGGHENMGSVPDKSDFSLTPVQSFALERVEIAGNYALQLLWSDGHKSGIYSWEYLRALQLPDAEDCQEA